RHLHRHHLRPALLRRRRAPQEAARRRRAGLARPGGQMRVSLLKTFLPALLLAGCTTVGPDYKRPAIALPAQFPESSEQKETTPIDARWWSLYGDRTLDELVASAQKSNADLRLAAARVSEAEAVL